MKKDGIFWGIKLMAAVLTMMFALVVLTPSKVHAQIYLLPDGTIFDSDYYASLYADTRAGYANGRYPERLLWHYLTYGIKEGRIPSMYTLYNPTTVTTPSVMFPPVTYPVYSGVNAIVPYSYPPVTVPMVAPVNQYYPYIPTQMYYLR